MSVIELKRKEVNSIKVYDEDNNEYLIRAKIPMSCAGTILENMQLLEDVRNSGNPSDPKTMEFVITLLEAVCKPQFPIMTKEWLNKNFELEYALNLLELLVSNFDTRVSETLTSGVSDAKPKKLESPTGRRRKKES